MGLAMTESVTRVRAGEPTGANDAFGQPIIGPPTELVIEGALFAPGGTSEPVEVGRAPVITEPTLYFRDQWPDITAHDLVRVRGDLYAVEGRPANWHWGDVADGGLVVTLKAVEG